MNESQQLLLWQWSTAVQMTSLAMIATFFALLARTGRRAELRWWAMAWAANFTALVVTLAYWYLRPPSGLMFVGGLYVACKTAFVLLFVQGVWSLARSGARLFSRTTMAAVVIAYGLAGTFFLSSIPKVGVVQHVTMALAFVPLAAVTARSPGLMWLAGSVAIRGALAAVEALAYAMQLGGPWGGEWQSVAATFMSASSAFDMSAEWLLVLGCVLAVSARAQRDLQITNHELIVAQEHLRSVADRDPLTALANRRALPQVFREVQQEGAMLLFFDLDDFKSLNDRHGHIAGDQCLRDFAGALRDSFRPDDYVIRYGGDEFLIVARGLDRISAITRLDDLAARVRRARQGAPALDYSVGMAELLTDGQPDEALAAADAEMYRAKADK